MVSILVFRRVFLGRLGVFKSFLGSLLFFVILGFFLKLSELFWYIFGLGGSGGWVESGWGGFRLIWKEFVGLTCFVC